LRGAALLCVLLILISPTIAFGGVQQDPNIGDEVLGGSGGLRYRSDSVTFDAVSGYATAEVGCGGPRWHLLGAGSESGGSASEAWQQSSRPIDHTDPDANGDDGWYASGMGPSTAEITAYSICIRDDAIDYPSNVVADSPSGLRYGSVGPCPGARWHVTTGSTFIATSDSWTNSSYPWDGGDGGKTPDDGWQGHVFDTAGGSGGFSMYAVCVRDEDLRYAKRGPVSISAGQSVDRSVGCNMEGEHVVGGGARLTGPADRGRLVASFPYDGADADDVPDDGWRIRVYNLSGSDKQVTAFAICLQGHP
jgi:hypothetical protein